MLASCAVSSYSCSPRTCYRPWTSPGVDHRELPVGFATAMAVAEVLTFPGSCCRDAVAELARLQPAAALQLQQLQQKLASLKTAVEPVPDDSWLHNMDQVQDTLQQFLATTSQLTDTYKQVRLAMQT